MKVARPCCYVGKKIQGEDKYSAFSGQFYKICKTKIRKTTFRFSYFSPNDDKLCLKVTHFLCRSYQPMLCVVPSTEACVALQFPQLRQFEALCEEAGPPQAGARRAGLLHFASVCPPRLQERQNNRHAFSKSPPPLCRTNPF